MKFFLPPRVARLLPEPPSLVTVDMSWAKSHPDDEALLTRANLTGIGIVICIKNRAGLKNPLAEPGQMSVTISVFELCQVLGKETRQVETCINQLAEKNFIEAERLRDGLYEFWLLPENWRSFPRREKLPRKPPTLEASVDYNPSAQAALNSQELVKQTCRLLTIGKEVGMPVESFQSSEGRSLYHLSAK